MTTPQHDQFDRDRAGDGQDGQNGQNYVVRHEERLVAATERHEIGRVTMRKVVVEEQHTITVTLRREDVEVVEEDAVDGPAAGAPGVDSARAGRANDVEGGAHGDRLEARVDSDTGELVLYAERPIITTEWVPVERVRLDRHATQGVETVTAEVAREVVELEDDRGDRAGDTDSDGPSRR